MLKLLYKMHCWFIVKLHVIRTTLVRPGEGWRPGWEHQEACRKGTLAKSAVAEHAWKDHHHGSHQMGGDHSVDMARHPRELLLKEAIHIQMTPAEERLNRDTGIELPGWWVAALKRQEDSTNRAGPTPTDRLRTNGGRRGCGVKA